MPQLQGALLCDSAHEYNGLVSILGGFVGIIQVQRLPVAASTWFAGRVAFTTEEMRHAHQVVVRAVDEHGTELAAVRGDLQAQENVALPVPEQMGGINLVFPLPFQIDHLGPYWVELVVDGDLLSRLPIQVVALAPPT